MGVFIKGIVLSGLTISKDINGVAVVQGNYNLVSESDVIIAKQSFNGYNDIKVEISADTRKSLYGFMDGIKKELETILGITEVKNNE